MKWKCLRCEVIFDDSDKKCGCLNSPSPWAPLNDDLEEISYMDTKFTGASHLDEGYDLFKTSPNTYHADYEVIDNRTCAVMYSECPVCNIEYRWTTTGLNPAYLTCKSCGEKFKV